MLHLYKSNGYNIVLDVNSGCVHSVDEVAYDIIDMYDKKSRYEIKSIILDKLLDKFKLHCQKIRHHFVTIYE